MAYRTSEAPEGEPGTCEPIMVPFDDHRTCPKCNRPYMDRSKLCSGYAGWLLLVACKVRVLHFHLACGSCGWRELMMPADAGVTAAKAGRREG